MAELVKFSRVNGAYKYYLRKSGNDIFIQDTDNLCLLDASGVPSDVYFVSRAEDRHGFPIATPQSEIISSYTIDPDEYCAITGIVEEHDGAPCVMAMVETKIAKEDEPEVLNGSYALAHLFVQPTLTADNGKFTVYLKRGKRFQIKIPAIGFNLWFMVPDLDTIELKTLTGTSLPLGNPF